MNKISQKMKNIAAKLANNGFKNRAEQFIIVAENIEEEYKMKKMSCVRDMPTIKPQEKTIINTDLLKKALNKNLTSYHKYKE